MQAGMSDDRPWYVQAFGGHYPRLYEHRTDEEARRCVGGLPRLAPFGVGPVLDLGCGAGRHLEPLAGHGVKALGVDLSSALLAEAVARRRTGTVDYELIRADMRWLPLRTAACSAVLSLFTAFGYFGALADHRDLVLEIARVLRPGGHWFFDFFNCELVRSELADGRPRERSRRVGPMIVDERRRLVEAPPRVTKLVRIRPAPGCEDAAIAWQLPTGGLEYREEVAVFSLAELDSLTAECGLTRVAAAGGYDGETFAAESSQRWLLVFQRA